MIFIHDILKKCLNALALKQPDILCYYNRMISIVVPVYNEEDSVNKLYEELVKVMSELDREYEIILIDDGSTEGTFTELEKLHKRDTRVKVISFRRNFGQTAAMSAGFDYAEGDVIVTLDADLQNDPADIPELLRKIDEGYDIVSGWRHKRKDSSFRVLPSKIANWIISILSGVRLHDYGCSLKAYRSEVVKNIQLYGDMHRFIPAVAKQVGAKVAEVKVRHHERKFGSSKYGFGRILKVFLDLFLLKFLLSFQTRPLRLFGSLGVIFGGSGFAIAAYLSYIRLIKLQSIADRPLLLMSVFLMVLGVQLVMMGLLGELMVRTYYESQDKKIYFVRKELVE